MFSFYGLSLFKIGSLENILYNNVNTVAFMRKTIGQPKWNNGMKLCGS